MILVTGAGGTIGREVVRELTSLGAGFRAAYHSTEKLARAREAGIAAFAIDFTRPETLRPALEGVERMFLLDGGLMGQAEREIAAVREAERAGVRHVVKLSVWKADGEAYRFAKMHRSVEKALESSGLAWTFVRPTSFSQNLANYFADTIRSQGTFFIPSQGSRIGHVDARDVGAVSARVLARAGHEGKVYTLTGPESITYAQVAEKLSAATGKRIAYVDVTEEDYRRGVVAAGIPPDYADALVDLVRYFKTGASDEVTRDVETVTGRRAIPFDAYARDYAAAFI